LVQEQGVISGDTVWSWERLVSVVHLPLLIPLLVLTAVSCSKPKNEAKTLNQHEAVTVTVAPVETVQWDRAIPIVGTLYPKDEARCAE
jgi:ABC-type transport system involved in cytochrome c biogenesis permease component